ncbi:hypothetical protein [Streptomyces sp. NPDC053048]|uniref:hypothetical protein n=1 Tax=Streptomyces sp. NPDC053048 TaxID=3365694 RepID=UPI0037D57589
MLDPSEVPQFTGNLEELDKDAGTLKKGAGHIRDTGANIHTKFQALSAHYHAPEAATLFATTLPVRDKAKDFGDDLEKVSSALTSYASEVKPLAEKLKRLKTEAENFVKSVKDDKDWEYDEKKIAHQKRIRSDIDETVAAFYAAERNAANKITGLVKGGTKWIADDGTHKKGMYGFTADDLKHAKVPWGQPEEEKHHWYEVGHWVKSFVWDGLIIDGVVGTVKGLGTLVGFDGWDAMKNAWKGLGMLAVGVTVYAIPATRMIPDSMLPKFVQDSKKVAREAGKAMVAWDEWGKNPARAAGAVTFNVLTTITGAGNVAKAGTVGKIANVAGKAGKIIDPMTYIGKGLGKGIEGVKVTIPKVGDLMSGLKTNLGGPQAVPAGLNVPHDVPSVRVGDSHGATPATFSDNSVRFPDGTILHENGTMVAPSGTPHTNPIPVELSAADRVAHQQIPTPSTATSTPSHVAAHADQPVLVHAGGGSSVDNAAHAGGNGGLADNAGAPRTGGHSGETSLPSAGRGGDATAGSHAPSSMHTGGGADNMASHGGGRGADGAHMGGGSADNAAAHTGGRGVDNAAHAGGGHGNNPAPHTGGGGRGGESSLPPGGRGAGNVAAHSDSGLPGPTPHGHEPQVAAAGAGKPDPHDPSTPHSSEPQAAAAGAGKPDPSTPGGRKPGADDVPAPRDRELASVGAGRAATETAARVGENAPVKVGSDVHAPQGQPAHANSGAGAAETAGRAGDNTPRASHESSSGAGGGAGRTPSGPAHDLPTNPATHAAGRGAEAATHTGGHSTETAARADSGSHTPTGSGGHGPEGQPGSQGDEAAHQADTASHQTDDATTTPRTSGRGDDATADGQRPAADGSDAKPTPKPSTPEAVADQVWKANNNQEWFDRYYRPTDGHRWSTTARDENGYKLPILRKDPNTGLWSNKFPPSEDPTFKWEQDRPGDLKKIPPGRLDDLEAAAKKRQTSLDDLKKAEDDFKAAEKAYDATGKTDDALKAKLDEADAKLSAAHRVKTDATEMFGENAAEYHAVPEHYGDVKRIDDRARGNDRFDQIYETKDGRYVVVEAKSAPGTELKDRWGAGPHKKRRVAQGTREYFETILIKMVDRGEIELADKLSDALDAGKLDYVLVKGNPNGEKYAGYIMNHFDID